MTYITKVKGDTVSSYSKRGTAMVGKTVGTGAVVAVLGTLVAGPIGLVVGAAAGGWVGYKYATRDKTH
jgi:phage-related tail protein